MTMSRLAAASAVLSLMAVASVEAFQCSPKSCVSKTIRSISTTSDDSEASLLSDNNSDDDDENVYNYNKNHLLPLAIPFLKRPKILDGELAGDFGFDPLNLAKDRESLWAYREIEIKHARLAMLAAVGWPMSELLDRQVAEYFGLPSVLDASDRVPSLLNGGMEKVPPSFWGACLGLTAAIDSYQSQRARRRQGDDAAAATTSYYYNYYYDNSYVPGDLGFDPLGLNPIDEDEQYDRQTLELQNGRAAMLGVTGFAWQEFVGKEGIIDETPFFFFFPFSTTSAEMALKTIVES